MRRFLFLLKSYPDIDHMAPVVWACLERGDHATLIFERPYDYADDYRIQLLLRYPDCRVADLTGITSGNAVVRLAARAKWRPSVLRALLVAERIEACFFEWGEGIPLNIHKSLLVRLRERRASVRFQASIVRDVAEELLKPLRLALLLACRATQIPAIALPHGISTKMTSAYNPKLSSMMQKYGGVLPLADRNAFSVWVHNTQRERELNVGVNGMNPEIAQVWGSLRFSPQWMTEMRRHCPVARLPDTSGQQLRLVFFLPKWRNNVDRTATLELLRQLAGRRDIQLVVKEHPRSGTSELPAHELGELLKQPHVCRAAADDHSAALVSAADVVVDVGSGMALDAVLQGRHLIYPVYLHTNRLAFDEWGGCLFARDHGEVHAHLDRIASREQPALTGDAVETLVRNLVYGGQTPYNVPDYYHAAIVCALNGRNPPAPCSIATTVTCS